MIVQHLIVPFGFAPVTVHRIAEPLRGDELEVHRLAGERPETRSYEEKPGEQLRPVGWLPLELARLSGEVDQDGCGIEDPDLFAAGPFRVDDRRHLPVWIDGTEARTVLFA